MVVTLGDWKYNDIIYLLFYLAIPRPIIRNKGNYFSRNQAEVPNFREDAWFIY